MPKRLSNTRPSARHRRLPIRPFTAVLRLAPPALATVAGTLTVLAALQLTPDRTAAPPPSWPTTHPAQASYLIGGRVAPSDATVAAIASTRGSSSRGGSRTAALDSTSPTSALTLASLPPPTATLTATSVPTPTSSPALTPSPLPSPTPEPQHPATYVVVDGDTVAGLAERFGISPETILWANGLSEGEALQAGQELTILPVSGVLYTVESGDTLHEIAQSYGVEPLAIVDVNALASPDSLSIGEELVIPGGQPLPPATPVPTPAATEPPTEAPTAAPVDAAAVSKGQEIAAIAAQYLGYAYVYGGTSPSTGFDCSGFTQFVYSQAGLSIPRGLSGQLAAGPSIPQDQLQPGDLVFFQNTFNPGLSHVTIYVGDGKIIHASSPQRGVTTDELSLPYWAQRYYGACRPW